MTEQRQETSTVEWDVADRMRKALRVSSTRVGVMADYLGVTRNTVGNYINGHTGPDKRTLRLWALRTGQPLEWLETGAVTTVEGPDGGASRPRTDSNRRPSDYNVAVLPRAA